LRLRAKGPTIRELLAQWAEHRLCGPHLARRRDHRPGDAGAPRPARPLTRLEGVANTTCGAPTGLCPSRGLAMYACSSKRTSICGRCACRRYRRFSFASRLRRALLCDYEPFPVVDPKDADGNVRPVTGLPVNPDRAGGAPVALGRSELTLDGREAVALGPVDRCEENPGGVVGKRAPDPR